MYYWNQDNFEGLLKLADALDAYSELRPIANYCRSREQGLRREAFASLEGFLDAAHLFDTTTARRMAVVILELDARTPQVHQFITQPLMARFLLPALRAWMNDEPNSNVPVRWLGIKEREGLLLERALSMCPQDTPIRKLLIDFALGWADYATHHLDESRFIGDVDEAVAALTRAKRLIAEAPDPDAYEYLASEAAHLERLVADWNTWSGARIGTFPEWCATMGRDYDFSHIRTYYYTR